MASSYPGALDTLASEADLNPPTRMNDASFNGPKVVGDIADAVEAVQSTLGVNAGVWQDYTPTWTTTGTAPAIGNGTLSGRYTQIGSVVHFTMHLTAGSTTTFGTNQWSFSLPVSANWATARTAVVCASGIDQGTAFRGDFGEIATASTFMIHAAGTGSRWGSTVPHTWANTDYFNVSGVYEAA